MNIHDEITPFFMSCSIITVICQLQITRNLDATSTCIEIVYQCLNWMRLLMFAPFSVSFLYSKIISKPKDASFWIVYIVWTEIENKCFWYAKCCETKINVSFVSYKAVTVIETFHFHESLLRSFLKYISLYFTYHAIV